MLNEIEFDILLKNKPGAFAEVCDVFTDSNINMRAFALTPVNSSGILQVVVDDVEKTRTVLKNKGIPFVETTVLTLECADKPGEIATAVRKLSKAGINVDFGYASGSVGDKDLAIFEVEDVDKALAVLKSS